MKLTNKPTNPKLLETLLSIQVTCMAGERPDSVLLTSSRELQMQCPTLKPMLTPLTTVITSNNNNNHRNSSGDIRNDNDNDNVDNNDKS